MKILSFFKDQMLPPAWSFSAEGVIWSIASTETGKLIGEERDLSNKRASFFCIELKTGRVLWRGKNFGEQWWAGIEAVHRDVLFLHGFAKPDMPGHKGIVAVEIDTGKQLWSNNDVRFVDAERDSVFGCNDAAGEDRVVELNCDSGEIIRTHENYRQTAKKMHDSHDVGGSRTLYPAPVGLLSVVAREELIKHPSHIQEVGGVEAIECGAYLVFSFLERAKTGDTVQPLFNTIIKVLKRETGAEAYKDELAANVPSSVSGLFQITDDVLLYVKHRTSLVAVNLSTQSGG